MELVGLAFYQDDFFPNATGRDYDISPVLTPIEEFRREMTIFSGLDHRGRNGHEGWRAWMSGRATGSVSMDQLVADAVGDQTRFASLQVTCGSPPGAAKLSFTKEGVPLPMIGRPSVLYKNTRSQIVDGCTYSSRLHLSVVNFARRRRDCHAWCAA